MNAASKASPKQRRVAQWCSGAILLCLVAVGNAILLRHSALQTEEMPFIRMLASYGKFGFYLGAAAMFLAILSTLTACIRGTGRNVFNVCGMIAVAMLGFDGVVERLYPLLGGVCFLMLAAAKLMNCVRGTFISRRDML